MSHHCTQEPRIASLESKTAVVDTNIGHLVDRLDGLNTVLYAITLLLGGSLLTALGYLLVYWVKGG